MYISVFFLGTHSTGPIYYARNIAFGLGEVLLLRSHSLNPHYVHCTGVVTRI